MSHFPQRLRQLPPFEGPFDAFKLEAKNCDVLFASYPAGTAIKPHSHEKEPQAAAALIKFVTAPAPQR